MMIIRTALISCLALSLCIGFSTPIDASAEELGRLFFTPKERAALDQPPKTITETPPEEIKPRLAPPSKMTGYVTRSDGPVTVWRNGKPKYNEDDDKLKPSSVETSKKITVKRSGERSEKQ
jgi:hypothetical protein